MTLNEFNERLKEVHEISEDGQRVVLANQETAQAIANELSQIVNGTKE